MKRFFVDTENVGYSWIEIAKQNPYSIFYLVYSEHTEMQKLNLEMFKELDTIDFRFCYCKTNNEKNALDYALVKLMRRELLEQGCLNDELYIISNDKGYKNHEEKFGLYQIQITRVPVATKRVKYKLTTKQKKDFRRLCSEYHYSWTKKEMSKEMREECKAIIKDKQGNLDKIIDEIFISPSAKWEFLCQ